MGSRKTPGVCACGNKTRSNGIVNGKRTYKSRCATCRGSYIKGDCCELCGFTAAWRGQLDVDHIDGDRDNNDPANLQTLCANCHRLKTHLERDSERAGDVRGDPSTEKQAGASRELQGVCACGNKATAGGGYSKGKRRFQPQCWSCRKYKHRHGYAKQPCCELCGFVAEWHSQLDVDHRDGNKQNNSPDNLWTLCANCHRIKGHQQRDFDGSGWGNLNGSPGHTSM
jgi:5-methylcytosine-specific restriction endonuclease McrA